MNQLAFSIFSVAFLMLEALSASGTTFGHSKSTASNMFPSDLQTFYCSPTIKDDQRGTLEHRLSPEIRAQIESSSFKKSLGGSSYTKTIRSPKRDRSGVPKTSDRKWTPLENALLNGDLKLFVSLYKPDQKFICDPEVMLKSVRSGHWGIILALRKRYPSILRSFEITAHQSPYLVQREEMFLGACLETLNTEWFELTKLERILKDAIQNNWNEIVEYFIGYLRASSNDLIRLMKMAVNLSVN